MIRFLTFTFISLLLARGGGSSSSSTATEGRSVRSKLRKLFHKNRLNVLKERKRIIANRAAAEERELIETEPEASSSTTSIIFTRIQTKETVRSAAASQIYVNAQSGNDSRDGSSAASAVRSLSRALALVKNKSRPLTGDLIVNLSGTFEKERIVLNENHAGTSSTAKVIFRGGSTPTRLLGGNVLSFVKVSDLASNHPARQLANNAGTSINNLYAAPPPPSFPSNNSNLQWPDGDCRDLDNYRSPPQLSVGGQLMDRAREPNLPQRTKSTNANSMGETRDTWLRTRQSNNAGRTYYKSSSEGSINKASSASWNNDVYMHMFPLVDWYDARVRVSAKNAGGRYFATTTNQNAPGNPDGGNNFRIVSEARYYLEGAIEYLDTEGEYHTSLGSVVSGSRGWTLYYPPNGTDISTAVLSISRQNIIEVEGEDMHVSFENLAIEGGRGMHLAAVYGRYTDFYQCSFVNSALDMVDVYGTYITFRDCTFEGAGGSAIRMGDDRDFDTDGYGFGLLESGNGIINSLVSDFASSCRHYSEGLSLGGYGNLVSNNHFRSSNMAAVDIALGMARILYNVFSHVSDGSYDDGALHWVAESPMERGNEVAYNVFFRNGVSTEPCNAETSCYQADVYMDDMAGAMSIHGNVFIKDKVEQSAPPNNNYAAIEWLAILVNGGADVNVYENSFLGPPDGSTNGAIYQDKAALFVQTSGGTIWPDGTSCGNTGVCQGDVFYSRMRKYKYNSNPWAAAFPDVTVYNANPAAGSGWRCANTRSCPMASWNNTVVCNSAIGSNRVLAHRALWPSDSESSLSDEANEGVNVPPRNIALKESGNKQGRSFTANIDSIESAGMSSVLEFAKSVAVAGEATPPACDKGARKGATRSDLAGRWKNSCTGSWIFNGISSCDPCNGNICAPRDLNDDQCSCGTDTGPPPPPPPSPNPPSPSPPSPSPPSSCTDDCSFKFRLLWKPIDKGCAWLTRNKKKAVARKVKYCSNTDILSRCPGTCSTSCADDPNFTFILDFVKKDVQCNWITKNRKQITQRKAAYCNRYSGSCPVSCGRCAF
uniref:Right handed beta helix domain-containing protein n=1 Tax=Chaetoceros debilis TaxID=122233 RepID=A0A6S8YFR0_9STRA